MKAILKDETKPKSLSVSVCCANIHKNTHETMNRQHTTMQQGSYFENGICTLEEYIYMIKKTNFSMLILLHGEQMCSINYEN